MLFHSVGRWLKAEFISLQVPDQVSYNDAPRSLPILRSRYRENHVAYRSDTHYGVGDLSNRVILCSELQSVLISSLRENGIPFSHQT